MALHFSSEEFAQRSRRTMEALKSRNLDGLLMFRQESMYYLSGYDSFGYVFFQCLYLGADGRMMLLTRAPDLRQARHTSILEDIRIWTDGPDANPAKQLKHILDDFGCKGRRLGVEYDAYGLTAKNGKLLEAALSDFCILEDASDLVSRLRVIKSAAELEYVCRAAELADRAYDEAYRLAGPGVNEGDILAAMQGVIFSGDGDYPGNEFIIGSGKDALLCRYKSGRRKLDPQDQLTLEWAAAYRHYHAAMMRTIPIGQATERHKRMHVVTIEAMDACLEALKPGRPIGEVFDAYAHVCDTSGMRDHRLNATGYSLGTTFAPNWMDWPMFYHANPVIAEENMVYFLHMILMDSDTDHAMCFGHTVVVTEIGCEVLSRRSLDLIVK
ncbi:MAG: Xaa-Pro peptidase family protein [Desulfobacteraceae bacterium]|jgi:Xaa-Pro dipeptidase|nr:Xaa-Pro peptidase family protein [Desulfobacteraceae bacterium]